jgi:hypothetical protein
MKDMDWGYGLFVGVIVAGFTLLSYMMGHDDGWASGNEARLNLVDEALETASKIEENK